MGQPSCEGRNVGHHRRNVGLVVELLGRHVASGYGRCQAKPMWDSGVRNALKLAAVAESCDFLGLGPPSLRRANITWRQEVGGSNIETSQIAGHANTKITEEYTVVQLRRQEE